MKTTTASHTFLDPCCEAMITFTPQGDVVEIAETCHPDLPAKVNTLPIEEARALYRRLRSQGMVAWR